MEVMPAVAVPLRVGKKMKKRKELDALVAHNVSKRPTGAGVSSHEQLLTDSSDEWAAGGSAAAARGRRRALARGKCPCSVVTRLCSVLLIFTCAIATTTVMWLFLDVRQQVTSLRTELNQVVAAHQGVADALHACHSLSRELHKNQSDIFSKLTSMALQQSNWTVNVTRLQDALTAVQLQLNASPNIVNDPRLVNDLSKQVAEFGSKIQDLQTTVALLKEEESQHQELLTSFGSNVTFLYRQVRGLTEERAGVTAAQLDAVKVGILTQLNQLAANVTKLNDTLTSQLNWTVADEAKEHVTVESLQEMDQNITARLRTVEDIILKNVPSTRPPLTALEPNPVFTANKQLLQTERPIPSDEKTRQDAQPAM